MAGRTQKKTAVTAIAAHDTGSTQVMSRASDSHTMPVVRVVAGADQLSFVQIFPSERVIVGRESDCELVLQAASVSRHHAAISANADSTVLTLEDLGSTNGTLLDGVLVEGPQPLNLGAAIRLGGITLRVEVLTASEIRQLTRIERRLEHASTDPLTGLRTRRAIEDEAAKKIERPHRNGAPVSAVFIDIDRFKQINDTHGHPTGDAVLRTVARIALQAVRSDDLTIRFGGEEFLVLLPNCGREDARTLAERIRTRVKSHDWTNAVPASPPLEVTVSCGVAVMNHDLDSLITDADRAMYQAKQSGRNCVVVT